ncbi:NAD(P)-binding domain-containing protein [Aurantimonas sp. CSK15Z-1]|nr:NAD(P)-binding domain-containing protein [Aurantimonas sp. CSK15Z-1]MCQ8781349.1 NAD(P)-binding domain-containing protein [Aurantimonas sp. CSK15Z-1]
MHSRCRNVARPSGAVWPPSASASGRSASPGRDTARDREAVDQHRRHVMSDAIIGFGAIGKALAAMFARKGIDVMVATRRPPETHAAEARSIGPGVRAVTLEEALAADTILLAVPFRGHVEVAAAACDWRGKTVIDVTNGYGVPEEELGGASPASVVAQAFSGAQLVKAFNHLPARLLAQDPSRDGGRRVIFVTSDDEAAADTVCALVERLGFAAIKLGKLDEGGALVQGRGNSWGRLIFKDLVKSD